MKSRIFLSCGQRKEEIGHVGKIRRALIRRGFEVYVALEAQSIAEINAGIIEELKNSDFLLFVNFLRANKDDRGRDEYPGSFYSHQEFAIAYSLGFGNRILVVNQKNAPREGILRHFGCNSEEFDDDNCVAVVLQAVRRARWKPDFSRRLEADPKIRITRVLSYSSQDTGIALRGRMLRLKMHNHRSDIAALEATGMLVNYKPNGSIRAKRPKHRSPLKAAAHTGYSHTIFPKEAQEYDLICVGRSLNCPGEEQRIYLNSALDLVPTPHLEIAHGTSLLTYEFYAISFPVLRVVIELRWPKNGKIKARVVEQTLS